MNGFGSSSRFPARQIPPGLAMALADMARHEQLRAGQNEAIIQAETARRGQEIQATAAMEQLIYQMAAQAQIQAAHDLTQRQIAEGKDVDSELLNILMPGLNLPPGLKIPGPLARARMETQSREEIAELRGQLKGMGGGSQSFSPITGEVGGQPMFGVFNRRTGQYSFPEVPFAPGTTPHQQAMERNAALGRAIQKWGPVAREHRGIIPFDKLDASAAEDFARDAQSVGSLPFPVKPPTASTFWQTPVDPRKMKAFESLPKAPPIVSRGGGVPQGTGNVPSSATSASPSGPFDKGQYGRNKQTRQMGWWKDGVFTPE